MERVFESIDGSAYLEVGKYISEELLNQCVSDIEPKLEQRPEIVVYGRVCRQRRDVGFFSSLPGCSQC